MSLLPVSLNLQNVLCLIVGGGRIAHRKTLSLLECRATVKLIAPQLSEMFQPLSGQIEYKARPFCADDCSGARLVFACTNDNAINLQVAQIAAQSGIWCNVCDDADESTFHSSACVRREEITIAVSTAGQSPALSRHLRQRIEACIEPEYGELSKLLSRYRRGNVSAEQFQRFFASEALGKVLFMIKMGNIEAANKLLTRELS